MSDYSSLRQSSTPQTSRIECPNESVNNFPMAPRGWPGTQDRDALFKLRRELYAPLYKTRNLDPWQTPLNTINTHRINQEIEKMGKNVCEYRTFQKTPVLWYYN